jgi:hypothetical protein
VQYAEAGNVATDARVTAGEGIEEITVLGRSHGHEPHTGFYEMFFGRYLGRAMDGMKDQAAGLFLMFAGVVHGVTTTAFSPLIYGLGRAAGHPELFGQVLAQSPALMRFGAQYYAAGWQRLGSGVTGGWSPLPHDPVYPSPRSP